MGFWIFYAVQQYRGFWFYYFCEDLHMTSIPKKEVLFLRPLRWLAKFTWSIHIIFLSSKTQKITLLPCSLLSLWQYPHTCVSRWGRKLGNGYRLSIRNRCPKLQVLLSAWLRNNRFKSGPGTLPSLPHVSVWLESSEDQHYSTMLKQKSKASLGEVWQVTWAKHSGLE